MAGEADPQGVDVNLILSHIGDSISGDIEIGVVENSRKKLDIPENTALTTSVLRHTAINFPFVVACFDDRTAVK